MKEHIQIIYNGVEFEVSGDYVPAVKGKTHLRNGDPGYPGEAAYLEDLDIQTGGVSILNALDDSLIDKIEAMACREIESHRAI